MARGAAPVPTVPVVLVVDDNPIARKMARAALAPLAVAVVEAADGAAALEAAARAMPAVALVDTALPDTDGFALARRLRALPGGATLPIFAVTSAPSRLEQGRVEQGGFAGRLDKPLEPLAVAEAVRAVLPRAAPPRDAGRGKTLLLAEPPGPRRDARAKRLEEAGFEVAVSDDGEKALERAKRTPPDAVLADVVLAGLDGLRLSVELRKIPRLARAAIVLVSDLFTEEADRRLVRRAGADALVTREDDPSKAIDALRTTLLHADEAPLREASLSSEEYSRRLMVHVGRQAAERSALERRLARSEAREAVLIGVAEALRHTSHARLVVSELLSLACDAAGVSRGAAYLAGPDGSLVLEATFAVPETVIDRWADLHGCASLLDVAFRERRAVTVPSSEAGADSGGRLLADAAAKSMIVTPLLAGDDALGVMVMASQHRDLGEEWVAFSRVIGFEVGQALALSRATAWITSSEQRTRRLLEALPQGVYGIDVEGRLTFVNQAASWMLGIDAEASVGKRAHGLFHAARPGGAPYPADECPVDRVPTDAAGARGDDESLLRSDGSPFPVEWATLPVRVGGEAAGAVVTFTDLTERRRAERALREGEERLRQAQKMEAVGRLASGVAHDFNNLLTAMMGYAELLDGRLADAESKGFADEILRAAERAGSLTRQLLAFSRKQVLKPTVLDLNAVAADIEPMLRRLVGAPVQLTTVLATGLRPVRADASQMEQVLLNLAVNARDAMPGGGALRIETANVTVAETLRERPMDVPPGTYVRLRVCDTGLGMPPETQERVFEPFFTTKAEGKGTGLGLATVHGVVEQSGGRLTLRSAPGAGTTFDVYLPAVDARAAARGEAAAARTPVRGGTETVLVAEDEEAVRGLVRRVLEDLGYAVIEARDGADALAIVSRREPAVDLLVTDPALARIGGADLLARARAARAGLRVLLLSGADAPSAGSEAILEKPFAPDALARRVRETLDAAPAPTTRGP